jgi:hypothetical protein
MDTNERRPKHVLYLYAVLIGAMTLAILAFVIPALVLTVADLRRHWVAAPPPPAHLAVPTPMRRGDPCPDPLAHTGPFDPVTGERRPGGYKVIAPGGDAPR